MANYNDIMDQLVESVGEQRRYTGKVIVTFYKVLKHDAQPYVDVIRNIESVDDIQSVVDMLPEPATIGVNQLIKLENSLLELRGYFKRRAKLAKRIDEIVMNDDIDAYSVEEYVKD